MALVRYIGPHTEGVAVSHLTDGIEFLVGHGETVELPDELVYGTPHELDDDGEVTRPGFAGVLAGGLDTDGNGTPEWELVDGKARKPARTDPAGAAGDNAGE